MKWSERELRGLDVWIAEHVMGFHYEPGMLRPWRNPLLPKKKSRLKVLPFYTTQADVAQEVLKRCVIKCGEVMVTYKGMFAVHGALPQQTRAIYGPNAETLELAICLFAKQLFTNIP